MNFVAGQKDFAGLRNERAKKEFYSMMFEEIWFIMNNYAKVYQLKEQCKNNGSQVNIYIYYSIYIYY